MRNLAERYIIILFCFASYLMVNAKVIEEYKLDSTLVIIKYSRIKVTDTIDAINKYREDILTLQAGKNQSAFYSAELKTQDSIFQRNFDYLQKILSDNDLFKQYSGREKDVIFKNYPEGKNTIHTRFNLTNWIYSEDIETPVWAITDSITSILGYNCVQAKSHFRGRTWIAWFSPEIPISNGPWKLGGLPGLILKAYDFKQHYSFEAIEISFPTEKEVEYFNYEERVKIDRKQALQQRRKHLNDNIRAKIASSDIYGIKVNNQNEVVNKFNHDFEETDYPHE